MAQRTLDEILALYGDNATGQISAQDGRDLAESAFYIPTILGGHADYKDTQYTLASPYVPPVDTWVAAPNNAGIVYDDEKPANITTYYDAVLQKIPGRDGDGRLITLEFGAKPTTANATYLDVAFYIGGGQGLLGDGRIYQRSIGFSKGQNVVRPYCFTQHVYNRDLWESGGVIVQIKADNPLEFFGLRYVIGSVHNVGAR